MSDKMPINPEYIPKWCLGGSAQGPDVSWGGNPSKPGVFLFIHRKVLLLASLGIDGAFQALPGLLAAACRFPCPN